MVKEKGKVMGQREKVKEQRVAEQVRKQGRELRGKSDYINNKENGGKN